MELPLSGAAIPVHPSQDTAGWHGETMQGSVVESVYYTELNALKHIQVIIV